MPQVTFGCSCVQRLITVVTGLKSWTLRRTTAHSLIVQMAKAGAFSSSDILPVVEEFENPKHAEFCDHSAWALYNAATERMKVQSPGRQTDGFKALNSVLLPCMN